MAGSCDRTRRIVSRDDLIDRYAPRHLPHHIGRLVQPALILILTPPAIRELAVIGELAIVRAPASGVPVRVDRT